MTRAAPVTAAAIVDGSQVNLSWNDVSTSVSGYSIEQLMPDGVTWQEVQTASATASSAAVIGNFDPPGQYAFQVVAYQEMDEPDDSYELDSQASNRATVAASAWPASPTGLTATPVSNAEIDLTWAALANATSCEVDRTTDGQTWTTLATLGPGATSYNDTGLTDGAMYAYRVRATNSVGGSGYAVDGASTLPTAPANLEGTAVSGTQIDLSWTAAAYATGYTISMQEEGTDGWDVIGTVPASQTTFAATGLAPGGTEYSFCVAPTNSTSESAVAYIDPATINQAPTIGTPMAVLLSPTCARLSVLAADDGGESNLTYSWSIVSCPDNGGAYFSLNNSNAAKNTTVTFYAAGEFTFHVNATDALGKFAGANVDVLVLPVQTSATVSPTGTAILTGGNAQFTATALDQFGNAMTPQQPFTWSLGDGVGNLVSGGSNSQSATYTAPTSGGSASIALTVSTGGTAAAANVAVVSTPVSNWIPDSAASVGSNSFNSPYNVTLASAALFTFQDDSQGNVFKVYDDGALVLTTTLVNGEAYGQTMLAAGAQALTINWVSRGQPGNNGDEFSYRINQETLLGLTVWDNCSNNNVVTAIADAAAKTLTVAGVPWANDPTKMTASVCVIPGWTSNTDTNRVYVSIKRESDGGQPDQSLYYGPLSQFGQEDWTLTTNSQAVDFVIREWVDGNQDGQFDAGDDSREVDVRVVTPWTAVGTWTAGHAAMVEANADGASLAQLAWDITGYSSDAYELGNVGTITAGKQIDVTGLLNALQQNVSDQVVAAALATKNARFSVSGAGVPQYALWDMKEAQVDSIFAAGGLTTLPKYNCSGMGAIELARGLIMGALKPGEFDKLGLHPSDFAVGGQGNYRVFWPSQRPLGTIPNGYLVNFDNNSQYPAYQSGAWANEFAIKTGADAFVGWGIVRNGNWTVVLNDAGMKQELCDQFNDDLWPWQKINVADVPGYAGPTHMAWFLNIPLLAQMIFNLRTGQ